MSLQNQKVFPAKVASGVSLSSSIDLGGIYLYVTVKVPVSGANPGFNVSAGSPLYVQGSTDNVNYRRFYEIYTNAVATPFSIGSSVCGAFVPLQYFNCRYLKLECSGTVTGAATGGVGYNIICSDSL
jgi:hypothetical protein